MSAIGDNSTPSGIIGLELRGQGFEDLQRKAQDQLGTWENIERTTNRIGAQLDGIGGSIAKISAGFGVGAVLNDFLKLEDVASRAAIAVGAVGGVSSYAPYRNALRAAGRATSIDASTLGGDVAGMVGMVGAQGMGSPGAWGGTARSLGSYSRSFGIDVGTVANQASALELFQRLGVRNTQGVLGQVAAQAQSAGQSAQTGQWLTAISSIVAALGAQHPGTASSGMSGTLGALYGAVSGANPIFKDPSTFAAGVMGIDSASTSAYANPRLQAAFQMAGIGYWEQRGGLAGKNGGDLAKKILGYSQRQYGSGTVEQDLFLRSNFGDVSADMLKAFSQGKITFDQLQGVTNSPQEQQQIQSRSHANQQTPSARINRLQQGAANNVDGPLAWVLQHLQPTSIPGLLGDIAAYKGGKWVLSKAGQKLFTNLKSKGASSAVGDAAASAGGEAATAEATGAAGDSVAADAAGGARFGPVGALAGAALGFFMSSGNLADEDKNTVRMWSNDLAKRFGPHWISSQKARAWANNNLGAGDPGGRARQELFKLFDLGGTGKVGLPGNTLNPAETYAPQQANGPRGADKLSHAADKLDRAADKLDRAAGGPSNHGASFDPAGYAGTPAGEMGAGMLFARYLEGGNGGGLARTVTAFSGGFTEFADLQVSTQDGGGGSGGGGSTSGGGWQTCTLTWYDPALGGINSGNGAADPHHPMANGKPYQASALTCAAPAAYKFGTRIQFSYGRKTVTCTVTDRGGAITGNHFDLSRGAAQAVGLISAGRGTGKFRVVGGGSSNKQAPATTDPRATLSGAGSGGGDAAWLSGASGAGHATAARLGAGGGLQVHVNVDSRRIESTKRLVRG